MDTGFVQDLRCLSDLLDQNTQDRESYASSAIVNPNPGNIGPSKIFKNVKVANAKRIAFNRALLNLVIRIPRRLS